MISDTKIGIPVLVRNIFNEPHEGVYGRIVEHIEGSAKYEGIVAMVRVSTPHGSVIETGIAHLFELVDKDLAKLLEFEQLALNKDIELYGGKYIITSQNRV
ncbi:MAG: hypothetical protein Q8R37_02175 [Nanoarchaeota archaeon]|nr:hypothetical protein [Nanoarchaeota archaeon]